MDIEALKEDWTVVPDTITVSATTTAAKVAFWVFGELEGQGAQDGYGQGSDTLEADLPGGGTVWPDAHILVTQGAGLGDVTATIRIGGSSGGMNYEGTGTLVQTAWASGGPQATCTQTVAMTLEVDHIPGWVELDYRAQDTLFYLGDDNATCTLEETVAEHSMWTDAHAPGTFILGNSSLYPAWLEGTYDKDGVSGHGLLTDETSSFEITFEMMRKK